MFSENGKTLFVLELNMDIIHPLKHSIYGGGIVSYDNNNSLQFSISALDKEFHIQIFIKNSIKDVSMLLVQKDNSYVILCHSYGILIINTSKLLMELVHGQVGESYTLP